MTTKGDFATALKAFRSIIHQACLLAVTSQKDVTIVKALIAKVKEYITGLRIELEKKRLVAAGGANQSDEDKVRVAELACYFTVCGMEESHKFLALKSAVTLIYKMQNFITAGHLA